jgi:hypothetical protein
VGLVDRKLAELKAKLTSLEAEFERWELASQEHARLEKHNSQVSRVLATLRAAAAEIARSLDDDVKNGRVLDKWMLREQMILDVHLIWDFFRSKLALRYVDGFADRLIAADELAWACYQPAQAHATAVDPASIREPPLVFFSESPSPFAMPRGQSYESKVSPNRISVEQFRGIVKQLPIPLIGVPWFQTEHLPDSLLIAHEVGHHVEDDLRLELAELLAAVDLPPKRRAAWAAWCGEVFADTYGTLAMGPAFVSALADFLSVDKKTMRTERRRAPNWGLYPTVQLRVRYTCSVLRAMGLGQEADARQQRWLESYPEPHAMTEFEADIPGVASALVRGPYPQLGGARLDHVIQYLPLGDTVVEERDRLLDGFPPSAIAARILLSAAALAFATDPEKYATCKVREKVLARIVERQSPGTRFRAGGDTPPESTAQSKYDRSLGHSIFAQLE